jgi:hypothetical protein
MWFQHVVSLSADTKIYLGEASALAANGEFALRQGYELPDGLSLSSDGILSGMPTEIGNYEISFEYRAKENATFETNYSPKYHINICYKHEITITINHNNGQ